MVTLATTPHERGRDLVVQALADDSRDQKTIALDAGLSPGQITHLKKGDRDLTHRNARKLGRAWPHLADELMRIADEIEDANLRSRKEDIPGYLRRLTLQLPPQLRNSGTCSMPASFLCPA